MQLFAFSSKVKRLLPIKGKVGDLESNLYDILFLYINKFKIKLASIQRIVEGVRNQQMSSSYKKLQGVKALFPFNDNVVSLFQNQ